MRPGLACLALLWACASAPPPAPVAPAQERPPRGLPVLLGPLERSALERRLPDWSRMRAEARPDPDDARALATVPPGAEVVVYLGTWCGDSRREVSRLWSALDAAGPVPFAIRWIGVDRSKTEPAGMLRGVGLERVPTFVVRRSGREVGRVVESAPAGIEHELLALLRTVH